LRRPERLVFGFQRGLVRTSPLRHDGRTVRKTKIVATLGPATDEAGALAQLIAAGVDVVRLNFSHGEHDEHARRCAAARAAADEAGRPLAVLADLQGPKVRVGRLADGAARLEHGSAVEITTDDVVGDAHRIPCDWAGLPDAVAVGDAILLDDGRLRLEATGRAERSVTAKVVVGGTLRDRKSVNLPGTTLGLPSLTEKDERDLAFAVRDLGADYVALSFVRSGDDVSELKRRLTEYERAPAVIAKIEKPEAVERIEEVFDALEIGDGIMVARGDLGVETELSRVPALQKALIQRADERAMLCITATQMLESMIEAPLPTRAEASDVFNAILDGTDAVMLSAETAVGHHPLAAVETMAEVVAAAEAWLAARPPLRTRADFDDDTFELPICRAAAQAARDARARAVVALTRSGRTAMLLSKVDVPIRTPVFALTAEPATYRRMALYQGIEPVLLPTGESAEFWNDVDRALLATGDLSDGDVVVIASGYQLAAGATNVCKIVRLGERELY